MRAELQSTNYQTSLYIESYKDKHGQPPDAKALIKYVKKAKKKNRSSILNDILFIGIKDNEVEFTEVAIAEMQKRGYLIDNYQKKVDSAISGTKNPKIAMALLNNYNLNDEEISTNQHFRNMLLYSGNMLQFNDGSLIDEYLLLLIENMLSIDGDNLILHEKFLKELLPPELINSIYYHSTRYNNPIEATLSIAAHYSLISNLDKHLEIFNMLAEHYYNLILEMGFEINEFSINIEEILDNIRNHYNEEIMIEEIKNESIRNFLQNLIDAQSMSLSTTISAKSTNEVLIN